MKLEKRTEFCIECGLGYYKPFYEPMWLAKIMWKSAHKKTHTEDRISNLSQDYRNGVRDGEEAVIKLIPEYMQTVLSFDHETASKQLIDLIRATKN